MAKLYGNRWRNIDNISEGGQGIVVKVEDSTQKLPGTYALKRLIHVNDASRRKRFAREIETLRKLDHPNILKIIDQNLEGDKPYFVAEYCAAGSLKDADFDTLKRDIAVVVNILLRVIKGLEEAHKKHVIHRDIKPGNILFRKDGTAVLADFGICHACPQRADKTRGVVLLPSPYTYPS